MGLENVLDHTEGFVMRFDRERGRDPGLYYLRVFGEPGGDRPVGLAVRRAPRVAEQPRGRRRAWSRPRPCFLGADPASSPLLGGGRLRPLGRVEDLARDLVRSLPGRGAPARVLLGRRRRTSWRPTAPRWPRATG